MRPATTDDVAIFTEWHEIADLPYSVVSQQFEAWAAGRGLTLSEDVAALLRGAGYNVPKVLWTPPNPPPYDDDRVPFPDAGPGVFEHTKRQALKLAAGLEEEGLWRYAALLRLLENCEEIHKPGAIRDQQYYGASYRLLAAIGHKVGMDLPARKRWYRIAEVIPLSHRLAGHIIGELAKKDDDPR
jgi:hypothetical protein